MGFVTHKQIVNVIHACLEYMTDIIATDEVTFFSLLHHLDLTGMEVQVLPHNSLHTASG